mmetsp:Transcript_72374/g.183106  ORF Transcript_72374/g.183106 Transcript_72374/m.183106 type:complete len:292 (+) Transcript_72374:40-915(+)
MEVFRARLSSMGQRCSKFAQRQHRRWEVDPDPESQSPRPEEVGNSAALPSDQDPAPSSSSPPLGPPAAARARTPSSSRAVQSGDEDGEDAWSGDGLDDEDDPGSANDLSRLLGPAPLLPMAPGAPASRGAEGGGGGGDGRGGTRAALVSLEAAEVAMSFGVPLPRQDDDEPYNCMDAYIDNLLGTKSDHRPSDWRQERTSISSLSGLGRSGSGLDRHNGSAPHGGAAAVESAGALPSTDAPEARDPAVLNDLLSSWAAVDGDPRVPVVVGSRVSHDGSPTPKRKMGGPRAR